MVGAISDRLLVTPVVQLCQMPADEAVAASQQRGHHLLFTDLRRARHHVIRVPSPAQELEARYRRECAAQ